MRQQCLTSHCKEGGLANKTRLGITAPVAALVPPNWRYLSRGSSRVSRGDKAVRQISKIIREESQNVIGSVST